MHFTSLTSVHVFAFAHQARHPPALHELRALHPLVAQPRRLAHLVGLVPLLLRQLIRLALSTKTNSVWTCQGSEILDPKGCTELFASPIQSYSEANKTCGIGTTFERFVRKNLRISVADFILTAKTPLPDRPTRCLVGRVVRVDHLAQKCLIPGRQRHCLDGVRHRLQDMCLVVERCSLGESLLHCCFVDSNHELYRCS